MSTSLITNRVTNLVATILVGLAAGFFYTYQISVTRGLAQVGDATYVETFQAINATIRNPAFAVVFFGSLLALGAVLGTSWHQAGPLVRTLLASALLFYIATVGITFGFHVPMNNELAEVTDLADASAATARAVFEDDWNRLNLIRTFTAVSSFACLAVASLLLERPQRAEGAPVKHNRRV